MDAELVSSLNSKIEEGTLKLNRDFNFVLSFSLDSKEIDSLKELTEEVYNSLIGEVIKVSKFQSEIIKDIEFRESVGAVITIKPLEKRVEDSIVDYISYYPKIYIRIYDNEIKKYYKDKNYQEELKSFIIKKAHLDGEDVVGMTLTEKEITLEMSSEYLVRERVYTVFDVDVPLSNYLLEISKDPVFLDKFGDIFNEYVKKKSKDLKKLLLKVSECQTKKNDYLKLLLLPKKDKEKEKGAKEELDSRLNEVHILNQNFQYGFEKFFAVSQDPNFAIREKFKVLESLENHPEQSEEVVKKSSLLSMELYNLATKHKLSMDKLKKEIATKNILPTIMSDIAKQYVNRLFEAEIATKDFPENYIKDLQERESIDLYDLRSFQYLISIMAEKFIRALPNNQDFYNFDRAGYEDKFVKVFKDSLGDKSSINYISIVKLATEIISDFSSNTPGEDPHVIREVISKYHGLRGDLTPVDTREILKTLKRVKKEITKVNELYQGIYDIIKWQSFIIGLIQDLGIDAGERLTEIGINIGENAKDGFIFADVDTTLNILSGFGNDKDLKEKLEGIIASMNLVNTTLQKDTPNWVKFFNESGMKKGKLKKKTADDAPDPSVLSWLEITEKFEKRRVSYRLHRMLSTYTEKATDGEKYIEHVGRIKILRGELTLLKDIITVLIEKENRLESAVANKKKKLIEFGDVKSQSWKNANEDLLRAENSLNIFNANKPFKIEKLQPRNGQERIRVTGIPNNIRRYDAKELADNPKAHTIATCKGRVSNLTKWLSILLDELDTNLQTLGGKRGDLQSGLYFELSKVLNDKDVELQEKMKELKNIKANEGQDIIHELDLIIGKVTKYYAKQAVFQNPLDTTASLIPGEIPKGYFQSIRDQMIEIYKGKSAGNIDPIKEVEKFLAEYSALNQSQIYQGLNVLLNNKIDEKEYKLLKEIIDKYFDIKEREESKSQEEAEIAEVYGDIQHFSKKISKKDVETLSSTLEEIYKKIPEGKKKEDNSVKYLAKLLQEVKLFKENENNPPIEVGKFNQDFHRIVLYKNVEKKIAYKFQVPLGKADDNSTRELLWGQFKNSFLKLYKAVEDKEYKKRYTKLYKDIALNVFEKDLSK